MAIPLLKCIQYFILAEKLGKNIACPIVILISCSAAVIFHMTLITVFNGFSVHTQRVYSLYNTKMYFFSLSLYIQSFWRTIAGVLQYSVS